MPDKENLLILHGALGAKSQFEDLSNSLKQDFNVLSLNFEGHGGKASYRNYSIDHFCSNVLDFLEEQNMQSIRIFGYSMGGYVALKLASIKPGKIKCIFTLGTKFVWTPETASREIKMLDPQKIEEKVPKFAMILKARHHPLDWKDVLHKTAEMMIELGNGAGLSKSDLSQIKCPVKITVGKQDKMVSIEESKSTASNINSCQFQDITDFEHPIEKANIDYLRTLIVDFNKNIL